jgi:hypothetical protein
MAQFQVKAPTAAENVVLELVGGRDVNFDGTLLQACMQEALRCATISGCLTPGGVRLTEKCVETLTRHDAATDCIAQGFGLRVKPLVERKGEKEEKAFRIASDD